MATLFDSNIVIDALKGFEVAIQEIADSDDHPRMSVISRIEVLAGCPDEAAVTPTQTLFARFEVFGPIPAVEERATELRRTTRLRLPDAIILATARVHGLTLSTRNTRDFSPGDPSVRVPYEL